MKYFLLCLWLTLAVAEILRFNPIEVTPDSVHNVHVEFIDKAFEGALQFMYGECDVQHPRNGHHDIGHLVVQRDAHPERLVWITPSDAPHGHCLHAFNEARLVGRSSPVTVESVKKRESLADLADMEGPWFDGIAYMTSKKNQDATLVSKAKDTSIAIVDGGMSGLMTSLLLDSVGIHNWHIIESSGRIGGRIRTRYLNNTRPEEYQYQEMDPMRFLVSITYADTNETLEIMDHRMVFQLADVLNEMNVDRPDLHVNFILWIQDGPNLPADNGGVRLPDGRIPTAAQVAANTSLVHTAAPSNETAVEHAEAEYNNYTTINNQETIRHIATNMYKLHRWAVDNDMFHWSEAGYPRYALGYNANILDYVTGTTDTPIWSDLYEDVYFAATKWRTIDKGLESLPRAIYPHVASRLTLDRTVDGLVYDETSGRIAVAWREDPLQATPITHEYDYAVVAAPFSKVRLWSLPRYSSLLSRAISTLNYDSSCKMALMYKTRFWEHLPTPIYGGCGSVDVPGVGNICYPSYKINSTGPGVILASYISGTPARSTAALTEEEHVALTQRTMV